MAVSPLITQHGESETKLSAVKAKSLAVRTSLSKPSAQGANPAKGKGAELSEQLNEETRQKYVKGLLSLIRLEIKYRSTHSLD